MARGARLRVPKKPHGSAEPLRPKLEAARLELRALYRSLDRMLLAQDLKNRVSQMPYDKIIKQDLELGSGVHDRMRANAQRDGTRLRLQSPTPAALPVRLEAA